MKPIWINYELWEDYKNGMYLKRCDETIAQKCLELFRSNNLIDCMRNVKAWKVSATVNLSKTVFNQQAWLGQATMSLELGATIEETTWAWVRMTKQERDYANQCADEIIKEFQDENLQ